MKILVAYASKHGSTAEIAQNIGDILRHNGHLVDVLAVDKCRGLNRYEAVVLGSALYAGQWMKEAVSFLRSQIQNLQDLPLYIFSTGPLGDGDASELVDGFSLPDTVKELSHDCQIRDAHIFHGKIDIRKLSLAELALFKSIGAKIGDYRKWDAIKLWAQHISDDLAQVPS